MPCQSKLKACYGPRPNPRKSTSASVSVISQPLSRLPEWNFARTHGRASIDRSHTLRLRVDGKTLLNPRQPLLHACMQAVSLSFYRQAAIYSGVL